MKTKIFAIIFISLFTYPVLGQPFQKRKNFNSDAEYGDYVKTNLKIGMRVKANQNYGDIVEGMLGTFYGDLGVDPPCNIMWDKDLGSSSQVTSSYPQAQKSHAYNLHWYMVTIVDDGMQTQNQGGQNDVINIDVQTKFTCSLTKEYTFTIQDASAITRADLIINGSDYDYDNDNDFTDFSISVNGNSIIYIENLAGQGMGANGNYSDVTYEISQYLIDGQNTIELQNTEDDGQVDYTFIKTLTVNTSGNGGSSSSSGAFKFIDVDKKFICQTTENYYFDIQNARSLNNVTLIINGSDFDYDDDGDYTDFALYVNDNEIFYIKTLHSQGMAANGDYGDISYDITDYLIDGQNKIELQNTETNDQVDFAIIKSITISSDGGRSSTSHGKNQGVSTAQMVDIKEHDINLKYSAGMSDDYSFYIDDINDVNKIVLVINGSDFDDDNDGDFTMFSLNLNGEDVFTDEELADKGIGTNGSYSDLVIDVTNYAKDGLNYFTITNKEDVDQTDYVYIKKITIKTN